MSAPEFESPERQTTRDSAPVRGLYDPAQTRDSCGIGLIVHLDGQPRHTLVEDAVKILVNLEHCRGKYQPLLKIAGQFREPAVAQPRLPYLAL